METEKYNVSGSFSPEEEVSIYNDIREIENNHSFAIYWSLR